MPVTQLPHPSPTSPPATLSLFPPAVFQKETWSPLQIHSWPQNQRQAMATLSPNGRTRTGWWMSSQRSSKWADSWQEQERHSCRSIKQVMGHPHCRFPVLYLVRNQGRSRRERIKGPQSKGRPRHIWKGKGILEATMSTGRSWMLGYRIRVHYLTSLSSSFPVCKTALIPPTHRGLSNPAPGFQFQHAQHRARTQHALMASPLSSKASIFSQSLWFCGSNLCGL